MSDTRQALEEAFKVVFPPPPNAHLGIDVPALEAHTQIVRRFRRFLDAEAWTDAAMMLLPDDCHHWTIDSTEDWPEVQTCTVSVERWMHLRVVMTADHPALALAQACRKARENGDGC